MDVTRPTALATNGLVATPHYLASQAGLRILQEGGTAVDAAVAANAVLQVVYPHNCPAGVMRSGSSMTRKRAAPLP